MYELRSTEKKPPDGGRFNDFPPNWREVTQEELVASRRLIWSVSASEYRQMISYDAENRRTFLPATLNWVHGLESGEGWAWSEDWQEKKIRFFLFDVCEHALEVTASSMCYREYKCTKCGWETAEDSSG